jgi:diguanylate cyclase (GGDEF)-like protein
MALTDLVGAELTPRARQTMLALQGEAEELRRALGDARLRIGYLEKLVDEDPLIPIANRRAFVRKLARMIAFAQRYGVAASIIYFDIDNMKQLNDAHGHAAGDAALLQVARLLVENVRNTDFVGRLGGDELGVLLVQADQKRAERKAAELVTAVVAQPLLWEGRPIPLTVAYGVHAFSGGEDPNQVIAAADRAMYRRKNRKKAAG